MADQEDLVQRLALLEEEVNSLKARLATLENQAGPVSSPGEDTDANIRAEQAGRKKHSAGKRHPHGRSLHDTILTKDGLESLIGGQLLNRIGIIILLFGVAYFLKYAFDNGWINQTGRIVIGLIAGVSLLTAGDMAMSRKYTYFSQGLTGGGIAVIYLTTFAAANYYQIFSPLVAFVLLVITALAGGLLSVRQNAYGVAIISTIGGFLSPFLIGSQSDQAAALLGYIVVLDLVILYLAYYKNWRSLNLLSFAGTAIVYIVYNSQSSLNQETLIIELFLAAFFVIFGTLAFFYNLRHQKPTKAPDVLLMVGNIAFFLSASLENLNQFNDWHGLFVLSLAVLYLVVSLNIQRKKSGDNLLFLSLLGIGLALVTIAIPIQLEEPWVDIAWLVEAIVLVYGGIRAENKGVWRSGVLLLLFSSLAQMNTFVLGKAIPVFNFYSLGAYLAIAGFFLVFYWFYSRPDTFDRLERKIVTWPTAALGTGLALRQLAREVSAIVHYYQLGFQDIFAVSLAWAVLAIIFMAIGMLKEIKGFRYISLAMFGITVIKIMLFDLSSLAIVFRVVILLTVGAILVGVSFAYLRKERGEQK